MFRKDTPPSARTSDTPEMQVVDYVAPIQVAQTQRAEAAPAMPSVPASEQAASQENPGHVQVGAVKPQSYVAPRGLETPVADIPPPPIAENGFSNLGKIETVTAPTVAAAAPPSMPGLPPEALAGFVKPEGVSLVSEGAAKPATKGQSGAREL